MVTNIVNMDKKKRLVTHSNKLTEARYSLTVGEQKIILLLISSISPDDDELKDYEMKVSDFSKVMGIKSHNLYERLNDSLDKLLSRVLHIPTDKGFLKIGWVSSAEYVEGKGTIFLSFDRKLKPYLLQLKEQFTKYNLFVVTQFKSSYSVRIYMLLKQYQTIGIREFELDDFRAILGIGDAEYLKFSDFRKRVLTQAKKEFETKNKENGAYYSDLTFDLETIRTGRKITRLRFIINKQVYQDPLPLDLSECDVTDTPPALEALISHGINEKLAFEYIGVQGDIEVLRCVEIFEEQVNEGKVKTKGAGLLITLLNSRAGKKTRLEIAIEEKEKVKKLKNIEKEQKLRVEKEINRLDEAFTKNVKKEFLASLSDKEKNILLEKMKAENPDNSFLIKSIEGGMGGALLVKIIPDYDLRKEKYIKENMG